MDTLITILTIIFFLAFPLVVFEEFSRSFISKYLYPFGITIHKFESPILPPPGSIKLNKRYSLKHGIFKFISYDTCLARARHYFPFYNLPIARSIIRWNDDHACVTMKIPVGITYVSMYLVFMFIYSFIRDGNYVLLGGAVVIIAVFGLLVLNQKRIVKQYVVELKQLYSITCSSTDCEH